MTVEALEPYLREHWAAIRGQLLAGSYQPSAVRQQAIPKSGGGRRTLGIPTVLDRFIQQLLLQVLQPIFDPTFSEHSHGFRPGRRAHDAVRKARQYLQDGGRWVVDVDLEQFFDRVNHDVLMGKLYNRIGDRRVLRIVHRYLEAGMMAGAGGGLLVWARYTQHYRGATSSGSESLGSPQQPQLVEPPDADPHVRWCGRGMVRITHHPLSRFASGRSSELAR